MNPNLTDRRSLLSCARLGALLALSSVAAAQVCTVRSEQKISAMAGGLGAGLEAGDEFGWSMCALGDLDGDGVGDLAVGAHLDDEGSFGQGAVWILFLEDDGTVKAKQKISATAGGFGGTLDTGDFLGSSVANLGDLDGDGVGDLAVGAAGDADGGSQRGAVWILFLETDGTVKAEQKISATAGGFAGVLHNGDLFGWSLSSLGDLDGDGIGDLAAGAVLDDDGGVDQGAVWILFLDANGTVKSERKISTLAGGFGGDLDPADNFGCSVAALGDLDGDGTGDLAVGASEDDDGDNAQGAVWILFLDADGTVRAEQKVSATAGGFGGDLDAIDEFGWSLCALGDLDGDGIGDLAVGARLDDDGGNNLGAVWILALDDDGRVKSEWKISATAGGFGGHLDANDVLGSSLAALGDLDGDGLADLAVGSKWDDDGATNAGAAWILFLGEDTTAPVISCPAVVSVIDSKGGPPGDFAFFTVTASDNCDPAPSIVCTPPSGSYFPRGTTVVTCTATDASGNMSLRTFPVVVMPSVRVR